LPNSNNSSAQIEVRVNGETHQLPKDWTISDIVEDLLNSPGPLAVELNREILRQDVWASRKLEPGDKIEIVHFVGGGQEVRENESAMLTFGDYRLRSRLIVGTGKYPSNELMQQALEASGADMVTIAVRRVDLSAKGDSILEYIDRERFQLLPNTAGCYTAADAVRYARLGREAGLSSLVKVEVIGDAKTLFPDNEALLEATQVLVKDGFTVLPYCNDDPIVCKKLEDLGAAAVMPMGAPIGSGLGIQNPNNIHIIRETISIPLIIDAGVGTASDAALAMELGADGVLMNTGIAGAADPVSMARAMKYGVEAGYLAYRAGRITRKIYATPSSPNQGLLN
jgi:thiazole synthase